MSSPLKRIVHPDCGPIVFGRLRPPRRTLRRIVYPAGKAVAPLSFAMTRAFSAVHDAAPFAPIYGAEENPLANTRYGDCTCAGALHLAAVFSALKQRGAAFRAPTTADALWLYAHVTRPAFDAATGANDDGADEQTVLEFWRTMGCYSDGSGKIANWSAVDATRPDVVRQVLFTNKNLYLGIELPDAWLKGQVADGVVWDVAGEPNPDNGHCVVAYGYNEIGVFIVSWGKFLVITWEALAKYCSAPSGELYTVVAA